MHKLLRFGVIQGSERSVPIQMTANEVLKALGGRFLKRNASTGFGEVADTTADLIGWAEHEEKTIVTGDIVNCIIGHDTIFRLPLIYDNSTYNVNYSAALMFEGCDLKVSSSVQYADPAHASKKSIIIVGGLAATGTTISPKDGYIDCMISEKNGRLDLAVGA